MTIHMTHSVRFRWNDYTMLFDPDLELLLEASAGDGWDVEQAAGLDYLEGVLLHAIDEFDSFEQFLASLGKG